MQTKIPRNKLDTLEQVYGYAMNLLNYRDYSSKDMFLKLTGKGANPDDAKKAIAKLISNGFINELHYAKQVYRAWLSKKTYGRLHLLMELRRKNVSEEQVPVIMEEFTDELELENALHAAKHFIQRNEKKIKGNDEKLFAAAARYMGNRGFSSRYIQVLLEQIRTENDM